MAGMVIVGAGEAGARAALALRDNGHAGPVTLIGTEKHAPYERPPLTKATMTSPGEARLPVIGNPARFAEVGIDMRLDATVSSIDRAAKAVLLGDGTSLPYEKLLLATGAVPRRLTLPGGAAALYLRTFDDAQALRAQLQPGRKIAVIGGGFIGLEFAASARSLGCEVAVVEFAPRILLRGVPEPVAALIAARHIAEGVALWTDAAMERIESADGKHTIVMKDGRRLTVDCILAGIGAAPDVALAQAAGLEIDNGIKVDAQLRTCDPDIYAAGDCCSFPHPLFDGRRIRLEARRNAMDQAALAAANMTGGTGEHVAVPWFWSDQYDVHLQIAGIADGATTHVSRDLGPDARLMFHLAEDGRLLAASGAGPIGKIAKEVKMADLLIARRAHPDPVGLADPGVRLKSFM